MSRPIEDRVRDLMADRTAAVTPPTDWEERIVSAGRRRRIRRRIGTAAGAVVAVVVVFMVVSSGLPRALLGIEPVQPPGPGSGPVDPSDLPLGEPTRHLHATGTGEAVSTIVFGAKAVRVNGYVGQLAPAEDGFVAAPLGAGALVYYGADSRRQLPSSSYSSGMAVSSDGKLVAWMDGQGENDKKVGDLRLAELPSGRVIRSQPVPFPRPTDPGVPDVAGFFGDRVVLAYRGTQTPPYAWDPQARRIEPLLGPAYKEKTNALLDVRPDVVLLLDGQGCIRNLRPSQPRPVERWKVCGFGPNLYEARISPDGRRFAGHPPEGDTVWVRDLATGRLIWQQQLRMGVHFGDSIAQRGIVSGLRLTGLAWESNDRVLVMYGSPRDLDRELGDLLRCEVATAACERVPTTTGDRVSSLGQ